MIDIFRQGSNRRKCLIFYTKLLLRDVVDSFSELATIATSMALGMR